MEHSIRSILLKFGLAAALVVAALAAGVPSVSAQQIGSKECQDAFRKWDRKPVGAFSLSRDGRSCGWSNGYQSVADAQAGANKGCAKHGRGCRVVAETGLATRPVWSGCKDEFKTWQAVEGQFKSFALSGDGQACGWSSDPYDRGTVHKGALDTCSKSRKGCHLIADVQPVEIVKERQRQLQVLGYYGGEIDGDWGPASEAALAGYQKSNQLADLNDPKFVFGRLRQQAESLGFHVETTADYLDGSDESLAYASTLYQNGVELAHIGDYDKAEKLVGESVKIRRHLIGSEHRITLQSLHELAWIYRLKGMYQKSSSIYEEIIPTERRLLGENDEDTLASLNNLAVVYDDEGRFLEAERLDQRVAATRERILGKDHPDTLASLNNLALSVPTIKGV